jgi:hypothetical protein
MNNVFKGALRGKINKVVVGLFLATVAFTVCCLPCEALSAEVTADASTNEGPFENIAGGINFWGQQQARQRFVNEVGADLYRLVLKLHKVEWRADTNRYVGFRLSGTADATVPDVIAGANEAAKNGCRIMVQIYGIPKWLSPSDDERVLLSGLPNYAKYPPTDFSEWARVVYAGIWALYGAGLAPVDYYEVFGEPNVGSTWYQQMMPCLENGKVKRGCEPNELGHNTAQVLENFLKVYEYTVMGIQAADPFAAIGGAAVIPNISGIWWTRFLAKYVPSYAMGFYSWHWFEIDKSLSSLLAFMEPYSPITPSLVYHALRHDLASQGFNHSQIIAIVSDIYDYMKDLEQQGEEAVRRPYSFVSNHLSRILDEEGKTDSALLLTEWNTAVGQDRRHDTHYGASFITRGFIDITDSLTQAQSFYCLSSSRFIPYDRGYAGMQTLFTLDGQNIPKAGFNAFKLFSMLGKDAQRISATAPDSDMYSIATKETNAVSLLATYFNMAEDSNNPDYGQTKTVTLKIENVPFAGYDYSVYYIDGNHSNSFYGSGPDLEIIDSGTATGDFEKVMDLSIYGVVMVQLHKSL